MKKQTIFLLPLILVAALLSGCAARISPLGSAAYHGNVEMARKLIADGADINAKDVNGNTPLWTAAWSQHKEVVELLILNGADLNIRENFSTTPEIRRLLDEEAPRRIAVAKARVEAEAEAEDEVRFVKAAQDYHDVASKPALPEEARKFRVQAEGAVRDGKFDEAAELYRKALNIAPWWPQGYFNRAIVFGESGHYQGAMREMKRYLILVPNAQDARAAQDKIYEWERKAGKTVSP